MDDGFVMVEGDVDKAPPDGWFWEIFGVLVQLAVVLPHWSGSIPTHLRDYYTVLHGPTCKKTLTTIRLC